MEINLRKWITAKTKATLGTITIATRRVEKAIRKAITIGKRATLIDIITV